MYIKSLKRHKENVGYFLQEDVYYGYHKFIDLLERIQRLLQENEQIWTKNRVVIIDNNNIIRDNDDPVPEVTVILPMIQPILLMEEGNHYAKYWKAHGFTKGYHIQKADSQLRNLCYAFSLYHDQIIKDTNAYNINATAQFNLRRMYYASMVLKWG
ncbi:hypothetical protein RhiirC2_776292 [Rhizophagus irregularis]|uniref:Uncharacterized protein n=1 Tax=Rhizophagus irregularis TaxID=588596 RepID=A0A2N1NH22_9GLOM|nr:hypothetical protein RhiirC2_776292 [Rhizophagus irregularis]